MLRLPLALGSALLVAACALVEVPPPPGTVAARFTVANRLPQPVSLAVSIEGRPLPGSAQPALLGAGASAEVTFFLPVARNDWTIAVGREEMFIDREVLTGLITDVHIRVDRDGLSWCNGDC
jgi:hypothetical protein